MKDILVVGHPDALHLAGAVLRRIGLEVGELDSPGADGTLAALDASSWAVDPREFKSVWHLTRDPRATLAPALRAAATFPITSLDLMSRYVAMQAQIGSLVHMVDELDCTPEMGSLHSWCVWNMWAEVKAREAHDARVMARRARVEDPMWAQEVCLLVPDLDWSERVRRRVEAELGDGSPAGSWGELLISCVPNPKPETEMTAIERHDRGARVFTTVKLLAARYAYPTE